MAESALPDDSPPVTFGVKVTSDYGHVHFDLFAGRTPHSRGRAGSLTLRRDEFEEFIWRLAPEAVVDPLGTPIAGLLVEKPPVVDITPDPQLAQCVCDLVETTADPEYPSYTRGKSNGCLRHPSERDRRDVEARRKARE